MAILFSRTRVFTAFSHFLGHQSHVPCSISPLTTTTIRRVITKCSTDHRKCCYTASWDWPLLPRLYISQSLKAKAFSVKQLMTAGFIKTFWHLERQGSLKYDRTKTLTENEHIILKEMPIDSHSRLPQSKTALPFWWQGFCFEGDNLRLSYCYWHPSVNLSGHCEKMIGENSIFLCIILLSLHQKHPLSWEKEQTIIIIPAAVSASSAKDPLQLQLRVIYTQSNNYSFLLNRTLGGSRQVATVFILL